MKSFSTFYIVVIITIILGLTSCKNVIEPDGACDAGSETVDHHITLDGGIEIEKPVFPLPPGNFVFYQDTGDTMRFYIYQNQKNICGKEHFKVDFSVTLTKIPPPSLKIYGEMNWSALIPTRRVNLTETKHNGFSTFAGSDDIGMTQTAGVKGGEVASFLTIQFESQGSQLANIDYLRDIASSMRIKYTYSKFTK